MTNNTALNAVGNLDVGFSVNLENRLYTGPIAMTVFVDDFFIDTDAGAPTTLAVATNSTAFNQVRMTVALLPGGALTNAHYYECILNRGWNTVILSRAAVPNVTRNAASTQIQPQLGGIGTTALFASSNGTLFDGFGPITNNQTTLFDTVTSGLQLRCLVRGVGANLFSRVFFKEIVDNYEAESKTCLIVDDARDSVYTDLFPMTQARGIVGTLPIISSLVGTAGYMTIPQITEMFNAGWDIVNHTKSHLSATAMEALSDANLLAEIADCDAFIVTNGWARRNSNKYFVAPFGGTQQQNAARYRAAVLASGAVASFGTTNRCIGGQLISPYNISRIDFNTLQTLTGTGYAIGTMLDQITNAILNGCSPMIMLHQFVNVPTDATMLANSEAELLLDRIVSLRNAGFTSIEGVTTAIPALTTGVRSGIRNLR
jgi:hypothetical protein